MTETTEIYLLAIRRFTVRDQGVGGVAFSLVGGCFLAVFSLCVQIFSHEDTSQWIRTTLTMSL